MWLSPGSLAEDPQLESALRERRAETEEGRYQPEDWPGHPWRHQPELRVTNPLDVAAAVAGTGAVLAHSGALMALAWALGVPHVALGPEESAPSAFAAWTGDASALAADPGEIVATIPNIFARTGRPPGFKRLEATLDQALDESAELLKKTAADVSTSGRRPPGAGLALEARLQELQSVNEALRRRLAAERLRFGERAALLEKAANTSVDSAIKAVHGQDLIVRRRLEVAEKELRRLQEETALQQAELRAIHGTATMRALAPPATFTSGYKGAALSEPGQVAVLRPGPGRPLDRELAAWLDTKGPSPRVAVVAGGAEGDVPEPALVDLLGGPLGVGAVVPLLFDVDGRVAEAGTFVSPSGAVIAFNTGAALAAPEHSFRRDVAAAPRPS